MKKIIFTICGFLVLSSLALEVPAVNDASINTESEYNKSGKFTINFGKIKHRRGNVLDNKVIEEKSKTDLDIDTKQIINQSLLDYTTQPVMPMF